MSNEQSLFANLQALRLSGMCDALQKVLVTPDMAAIPLLDVLTLPVRKSTRLYHAQSFEMSTTKHIHQR